MVQPDRVLPSPGLQMLSWSVLDTCDRAEISGRLGLPLHSLAYLKFGCWGMAWKAFRQYIEGDGQHGFSGGRRTASIMPLGR